MAHDLAKATGASVVVFHVSRPPAVVSDGDRLLSAPARAEATDVWNELRKIQATDPAVRVEHEVIVAAQPGAKHILRILEERGCDLIVMGTRGETGWKRPAVRQRDRGRGAKGPLSRDRRDGPCP